MIELPEAISLAKQINNTLVDRTITEVFNSNSPHKFTFFYENPLEYPQLLTGRKIISATGRGIFVDINLDNNTTISINDGVNLKYGDTKSQVPAKYQLLLTFDNNAFLVFTVAMYGGIAAYKGNFENKYHKKSVESVSPLSDEFNNEYFNRLMDLQKKNLSLKAFLATEQRMPGIGNGVIQDILYNASLNPRKKLSELNEWQKQSLFNSLKSTLTAMTTGDGRDTETDLFGNKGGYNSLLSKNTYKSPCPKCGNKITKESYLGGTVYYCPNCQPIK
jgi:formamidopyrimidine-DNA glycosylase